MKTYLLTLQLFDESIDLVDDELNELLETFRAQHGIDNNHPLGLVYAGFLMGMKRCIQDKEKFIDDDRKQVYETIESLSDAKIRALKSWINELAK